MIIRAKTTTTTCTERARTEHARRAIGRRLALGLVWVAVTLAANAASARTQVSVRGDSARVRLEASDAPLSEVLSALESAFAVRHRTSVPLDQPISGTYRGPLRHVLSRLLNGFSYYVADTAEGWMDITVVGKGDALPGAAVAAPPAAKKFEKLVVPPPTPAQVLAERQRQHHRRPPSQP